MGLKKGVFFSIDALIALGIILLGVLITLPLITIQERESQVPQDFMKALSTLKIGEINNSYVQSLREAGFITDPNKNVLEQLAEFSVIDEGLARNLFDNIIGELGIEENIGLWFGNKLVASRNNTPITQAKHISVQTQKVSGIQEGTSVTAYSGRAYLSNSLQSKYFYFGGYVGEGNISANINYEGNISSAKMELAIKENFTLYINGNYEGRYQGSGTDTTPQTYTIPTTNFTSGTTTIELTGETLSIAGGFIKISYEPEVSFSTTRKKYFPGITGIINLYDGIYLPGSLSNLEIFLKLNNTVRTFISIGNISIFNTTTIGIENFTLNNSFLLNALNYTKLLNKTIPLRIGVANLSGLPGIDVAADIASVVDISGSMNYRCSNPSGFCQGSSWICTNWCSGTWTSITPIEQAKNATKKFTHDVLSYLESNVSAIPYSDNVNESKVENLTNNETKIINKVNTWSANGGTCICCGINRAVQELNNNSNSSRFRTMIIMTDGIANAQCAQQNTGNAGQDAIKAVCDAYNNHSIITFTIGFGSGINETALVKMAECGKGSYYKTIDNLTLVYGQIAEELLEIIYEEQTLNYSSTTTYSTLFPESYIELTYNTSNNPLGLITTVEKNFDNTAGGTFNLPTNSSILEATLVSYSGSKWTHTAKINNYTFYNLSTYGPDYIKIGDPYYLTIPNNYINTTNTVNITTAASPTNTTNGSIHNKIIYTILQTNISTFSKLSSTAQGCQWHLTFEDASVIITNIPKNYTGSEQCHYSPSGQNISNDQDAMQTAVEKLLLLLDYDKDGNLDVLFNDQDLQITSSQIGGIPYDWSTNMQVRVWS